MVGIYLLYLQQSVLTKVSDENLMVMEAKRVLESQGWENPESVLKEDGEYAEAVEEYNYIYVNFYPPEDTINKKIDSVFVRFRQKGEGKLVNMPVIWGSAVKSDTMDLTPTWDDLRFDITEYIRSWHDLFGLEDGFHYYAEMVLYYCNVDVIEVWVYYTSVGVEEERPKKAKKKKIFYDPTGRRIKEKNLRRGIFFTEEGKKVVIW